MAPDTLHDQCMPDTSVFVTVGWGARVMPLAVVVSTRNNLVSALWCQLRINGIVEALFHLLQNYCY